MLVGFGGVAAGGETGEAGASKPAFGAEKFAVSVLTYGELVGADAGTITTRS